MVTEAQKDTIRQYNQRHSEANRGLIQMIWNAQFLLEHFWEEVIASRGRVFFTSGRLVIYGLMTLFYLLSPFDLVPEAIFGILGFADDFLIMALGAITMGN